jgi:hypothetical protein
VRRVLFVGDDWSEEFHDVELQDEAGRRLGKAKLAEGIAGVARLHAMIGEHVDEDAGPVEVVVGIETDRGPWVRALVASGHLVYPINRLQVARFRETERSSGGKSDAADAHTLADMVRTKRHTLKPMAGDSGRAETVKVLTRAHQTLIWERTGTCCGCGRCCASSSPPRWSPSTTSPPRTCWSCWAGHPIRCRRPGCRPRRSPRR